ncbi:MAG: hypothetical protein ACFCVK_01105 [Acidimicrobiales bacterium]
MATVEYLDGSISVAGESRDGIIVSGEVDIKVIGGLLDNTSLVTTFSNNSPRDLTEALDALSTQGPTGTYDEAGIDVTADPGSSGTSVGGDSTGATPAESELFDDGSFDDGSSYDEAGLGLGGGSPATSPDSDSDSDTSSGSESDSGGSSSGGSSSDGSTSSGSGGSDSGGSSASGSGSSLAFAAVHPCRSRRHPPATLPAWGCRCDPPQLLSRVVAGADLAQGPAACRGAERRRGGDPVQLSPRWSDSGALTAR